MKSVNLVSLVNAKSDLESEVFDLYRDSFGIKIKENELEDLKSLVTELKIYTNKLDVYDHFYIGFIINQIGKEFDLLRFGDKTIINIELKSENTGEKMIKQLIKNRYYLSFLGKEIFTFTYVAGEKKLYYLDDNKNFTEISFEFLISRLNEQEKIEQIEDINKLFDPSNYLVSPFNSTEKFIEGLYFLTDFQEKVKRDIFELTSETGPCFVSISGSAGTGKTLLTYDIAKEFRKNSRKILIIHCGKINSGQNKLNQEYSWNIISIKNFYDNLDSYNFNEYDLIIFDEVQRVYKYQLEEFIGKIINTKIKCIFSYDPAQCLARWEIDSKISEYIDKKVNPKKFQLTEKIRTNKEIASFIKNLFDLSKENPNQTYRNIDVVYFSEGLTAKKHIRLLNNQGWKSINYTRSNRYDPYEEYQSYVEKNAHGVIGQEFDDVIAVIDEHFYYTKERMLSTKGYRFDTYYHPTKMLLQILTRTRKRLTIIIINNEILLNQCLKILNGKQSPKI